LREEEPFEPFDEIPDCPNNSQIQYKVTNGGCMSQWQEIGDNLWELVPCAEWNDEFYCHEFTYVCKVYNHDLDDYELVFTHINPKPQIQCPLLAPPFGPCIPFCD
jgi:hypothetical protein